MKKVIFGLISASLLFTSFAYAKKSDIVIKNKSTTNLSAMWNFKPKNEKEIRPNEIFHIRENVGESNNLHVELLVSDGRRPYDLLNDNICSKAIITVKDDIIPNQWVREVDMSLCG